MLMTVVSRMPTPLATQAPDELGLEAPLQWEPPPCGDVVLNGFRRIGTGLWFWL